MFGGLQPVGKQVAMGKVSSSVYSNVNGHKSAHGEMKEQIVKNGKVYAKVAEKVDVTQENNGEPKSKSKVEVDIPSKGIHKAIVKDGGNVEVVDGQDFSNNGHRRSENSLENGIDKINSYSGLEYTPLDMAEYIFWTGDEKGVIMAIEEFLDEGLMSREEAINFLQSIKTNLDYMQDHYHGLQKTESRLANNGRSTIRDRLSDLERPSTFDYDLPQESEKMRIDAYDDSVSKYEGKPDFYDRQAKLMSGYEGPVRVKGLADQGMYNDRKKRFREEGKPVSSGGNGITLTEEDFEELLERLRVADFLYSEYSLEEVIYQLAKVVFSQSLTSDSVDAQLALQKFVSFLEKEARLGQISRSLEKKIIDLFIAALSDTLTEHPQLLAAVRENLRDADLPNFSSSLLLKNQLQANDGKAIADTRNIGKATSKASPMIQSKAASVSKN